MCLVRIAMEPGRKETAVLRLARPAKEADRSSATNRRSWELCRRVPHVRLVMVKVRSLKVCGGEGIEYGEEVVTVKIPAGVAEGMQLSMGGKGNAGKHNGIPGDLLILVEEEPHPELIRDENDLVYNLLLSFPTAAIGGAVEIPTIDGKVKVKIEAGTQPGKVLRLRGKGLPSVNGYGTGDLLVNVSVYVPETLSKEEKSTLEKLEESKNFKPSTSIKEKIFKKFRSLFD